MEQRVRTDQAKSKKQRPDTEVHTFSPSTGEAEVGRSLCVKASLVYGVNSRTAGTT